MMWMTVGLTLLVAWPLFNLALVLMAAGARAAERRRHRREATVPVGAQPTTFWIMIPCLNEERVVGRTVAAALALSGPPGTRTYVLVIDDASDDGTPAVLAKIKHPNLLVLRRSLPDARRGKGEALNAGYRFIRDITALDDTDPRRVAIGVIDGDGRGSSNLLLEVFRVMRNPEVGATQCRVRIHNRDRLLGAVQDLEFACIANASQVLRNGLGTGGLGGNGQFTRLSSLQAFGEAPWSKCLVEDLELGLRLHLAGDRIRYLSTACVTQQGVVDIRRLLRQRTRWAQGNLQCIRYVPRVIASRRIGNAAMTEMLYYLLAPWLNAIGIVPVLGLLGYSAWRLLPGHGTPFMIMNWQQLGTIVGIWLGAMAAPSLIWAVVHRVQLRDERAAPLLRAGLVYPAFLVLGLVSTWRAVGRQVTGRSTWAKTERLAEEPAAPLTPARPVAGL